MYRFKMSLIVYATENPLTSLFTFIASITLVKDIMNYMFYDNLIDDIFIYFYRFSRDNYYITESLKTFLHVSQNSSHAAVHALVNLIGFQITTTFYAIELATYALIRGSILAYQASLYLITAAEKTYEQAQYYLTYDPTPYSLTYWVPSYSQINYSAYYPEILSCITGFVILYLARQMTVTPVQKENPVKPLEVKPTKETTTRRRSPRLAMLYLTDHNLSSRT